MNARQITCFRRLALSGVLSLMAVCAGCGQSASPSDPNEGRTALHAALDAWKGGEKIDSLSQRNPSIHVTDGDWLSGMTLERYNADDNGKLIGSDVNFQVVLELKTPKGQLVTRNATYAVTTRPQVLVQRQDSL